MLRLLLLLPECGQQPLCLAPGCLCGAEGGIALVKCLSPVKKASRDLHSCGTVRSRNDVRHGSDEWIATVPVILRCHAVTSIAHPLQGRACY